MRGGKIHLRPLPGKFTTVPVVLNFLFIALIVVSGCHKDGQSGLRQTRKEFKHRDGGDDELSAMAALSVY